MVSDCIFCQIVRGQADCHQVYEDDQVLVFLDIFPVSPGHTLVIPKEHAVDVFDLPEASAEAIARVARRVAHTIDDVLSPDGLMVAQLNREAAGQTVFHYHMHLIPRWHGASMQIHGRREATREQLDDAAQRIASALPESLSQR